MSITVDQLSKNIQEARRQEAKHRSDADACAGAAQAYEQLLTQLVQAQRAEKKAADAAPVAPGKAAALPKKLEKAIKKAK